MQNIYAMERMTRQTKVASQQQSPKNKEAMTSKSTRSSERALEKQSQDGHGQFPLEIESSGQGYPSPAPQKTQQKIHANRISHTQASRLRLIEMGYPAFACSILVQSDSRACR
jgi:hypothetical protein